jgi:hypothetical protein
MKVLIMVTMVMGIMVTIAMGIMVMEDTVGQAMGIMAMEDTDGRVIMETGTEVTILEHLTLSRLIKSQHDPQSPQSFKIIIFSLSIALRLSEQS